MKPRPPLAGVALVWLLATLVSAAADFEEKYDSGKVKARYAVDEKGRKTGAYEEYSEEGKLTVKAQYKADQLEGTYATYHDNGKVRLSATYRADKLAGTSTEFDERGQKTLTLTYKNGKLNGALMQYEKGKATFTWNFTDGEPHGRTFEAIKKRLADITAVPDKKVDETTAENEAALRKLKAYRYLCEVPYENVVLDKDMSAHALAGSKLCEKIGKLDHTPANPGWPEADYKFAYEGTTHTNLAWGPPTVDRSVDGWMDDSDKDNIDRLGHRRWCINPSMKKTGFGRSGKFSAMWSPDRSQTQIPEWEMVCYPARGYMPVEYFGPKYAWSVSFNPTKYQAPKDKVTPRIFEVDEYLRKSGDPLKLSYTNVNADGFGTGPCLVFLPEKLDLTPGKRYLVEIDGLTTKPNNTPAPTVRYLVEFASLK